MATQRFPSEFRCFKLIGALGQLVEVTFSDSEDTWRAAYDGLGRRLWREYQGRRTDFYWDGDRLAAEVTPGAGLRLYIYSNTDSLVPFMWLDYDSEHAAPESGKAYFLFTNGTGMPLRVEDQRGQVAWRADRIEPYGNVQATSPIGIELRLRFAGHFLDTDTGLFYNRYRDYDPSLGRYLQPDPIDFEGGINLYAYPAKPVVDVDLLGLIHVARPLPEHLQGKDINAMSPEELKDLCRHHADELARAQEPREGESGRNTFAVGVAEKKTIGADGEPKVERRMVATSNLNEDQPTTPAAKKHMAANGIEDRTHGEEPHVTTQNKTREKKDSEGKTVIGPDGKPERETVLKENGKPERENVRTTTNPDGTTKQEPYDKQAKNEDGTKKNTEHHAEQRMENAELGEGEQLAAQSPSQSCCPGCQKTLGTPNSDGSRPIDKIPADRQVPPPKPPKGIK